MKRELSLLLGTLVVLIAGFGWYRYLYFVPTNIVSISNTANVNSSLPTGQTIYAVGDIADCTATADDAVADLLKTTTGPILTLGDTVYPDGSVKQFTDCFDPAWGTLKSRIRPVVGNHEYQTKNAAGYYGYFGVSAGDPAKGYYSYDLGAWHLVALNANCGAVGGCGANSPEIAWLKKDLSDHPARCTLAYYHQPRWSSGEHGNNEDLQTVWQTLVTGGVDVVLNGHDHDYERFAPLDAVGRIDESGTREFVVGTGGKSQYNFIHLQPRSEARDNTGAGVLRLTLSPTGYVWKFMPVTGAAGDSGASTCH